MKIKTSELTGAALDWAVAKCEYPNLVWGITVGLSAHAKNLIIIPQLKEPECFWSPSTGWSQGGPIIERENISIRSEEWDKGGWYAFKNFSLCLEVPFTHCSAFDAGGNTALESAMRCYVASKLGEEVDIPEELL